MKEKSRPDWFKLIQNWKPAGMGAIGPTLPFLIGSLNLRKGQTSSTEEEVRAIVNQIIREPVPGYVTEIVWCTNIKAPVFQVSKIEARNRMTCGLPNDPGTTQNISFSNNLAFQYESKDPTVLLEKILTETTGAVSTGRFSRNLNWNTGAYEYGDFRPAEIEYINKTMLPDSEVEK